MRRSPIGLDLGASAPEETAVSVAAEIIAHTNQGTDQPMSPATGTIHQALLQRRPVAVS
jgi:xanthine dehydrogenase accessory factor